MTLDERLDAIETRVNELNAALLFTMKSMKISMMVPTGMMNAQGQPLGHKTDGDMLFFYERALRHGLAELTELRAEHLRDDGPRIVV